MRSGPRDPGPGENRPRITHYLVGSTDPALLAGVARQLGDEEKETVRVVSGTSERPSVLAVAMTAERAEQLRAEFQDRLVIEIDQTVEPYASSDGPE